MVNIIRDSVVNRITISGGGGGGVTSVTNADGSLTISPTTGAAVASINTGHGNNFSTLQTFSANGQATSKDLTKGVLLANATAATSGSKGQNSPFLHWQGNSWSGSANQSVDFIQGITTSLGNSPPSSDFSVWQSINGGSYQRVYGTSGNISTGNNTFVSYGSFSSLGSGANNFNGPTNFQNTLSAFSSFGVNGPAQFGNTVLFQSDFKAVDNYFYYSYAKKALSVGRNDTLHNASIEGLAKTDELIAPPTTFTATAVQIFDVPAETSVFAVQTTPQLGNPTNAVIAQSNDASGPYTANGSTYTLVGIWSYDDTSISNFPSQGGTNSFTDSNDGATFDIQYSWNSPSITTNTPTGYYIGLSINGGSTQYVFISGGAVSMYLDTTGSYPDSLPSPLYGDYLANGITRNYTAYAYDFDVLGNPYYQNAAGELYSMFDDNSGNLYQVAHEGFFQPNDKVIGAADGTSATNSFLSAGSFFLENSLSWASTDLTVSPIYIGVGYIANGATLNITYDIYNYIIAPSGLPGYSTNITSVISDPNDGNYYQIVFSISGATPNYKILRSDDQTGAKIDAIGDTTYESWSDSTVVTPLGYFLAGGWFEAGDASSTPLVLKTFAGQTALAAAYEDSTGAIVAGLGPNYEPILPQIASTSAANNSLFTDPTFPTLLSFKDNGGLTAQLASSSQPNTFSGPQTFSSKILMSASNSAEPCFNMPAGSAPSSPNNGDMWFDGTNVFLQVSGVTKMFTLI